MSPVESDAVEGSTPPAAQLRADLDRVTALVAYLTVLTPDRVPEGTDWFRCSDVLADPDQLGALIDDTGAGRGSPDRATSASLFVQAWAYRVASAVLPSLALNGRAPDVDPSLVALRVTRNRPGAVALLGAPLFGTVADPAPVDVRLPTRIALVTSTVGSLLAHLDELVSATRSLAKVGERLLWGNVASSAVSVLRSLEGALDTASQRQTIRSFTEEVLSQVEAQHGKLGELFTLRAAAAATGAGHARAVAESWHFHRRSCCLWYHTTEAQASVVYCADCSLRDVGERKAQLQAELDAGG